MDVNSISPVKVAHSYIVVIQDTTSYVFYSFFLRDLLPNKITQAQKYEYMNAHNFYKKNIFLGKIKDKKDLIDQFKILN